MIQQVLAGSIRNSWTACSRPNTSSAWTAAAKIVQRIGALRKHYVGLSIGAVVAWIGSCVPQDAVAGRHRARVVSHVHPAVAGLILVALLAAVYGVVCQVKLEGPVGYGGADPVDASDELRGVALWSLKVGLGQRLARDFEAYVYLQRWKSRLGAAS